MVRPVFDASARTPTGVSLNNTLKAGPNMYPLLTDILLKFRNHTIAYSVDISKMFCKIKLHPGEKDLHRFILQQTSGTLVDCRMTRVTFGLCSYPFLVTQMIRDMAVKHADSHPKASRVILEYFYVNDFIPGSETIEAATLVRSQLCHLLSLAKMTLRKWQTNNVDFRNTIPEELVELEDLHLTSPESSLKTLGIHWSVTSDNLHVATPTNITAKVTKQTIASVVGKVFDLLGMFLR